MESNSLPAIDSFRFEGLSFTHENHDATLLNCDFEFPANRVLRVKSPEGAGKSTLLQILAGLLIPQGGRFYINEEDVVPMSFEEFLPYRLSIGYTFDYGGLLSNRNIFDNIVLPLVYHKLLSPAEAKKRVSELVERFELGRFAKERPAHVPGRVRKLAIILRGAVTYPQMLLLDDPSVGLGEGTNQEFVRLLAEMRKEHGLKHVIVSSHDDKFMSQIPHDIIHLDGGLLYHQVSEENKVVGL